MTWFYAHLATASFTSVTFAHSTFAKKAWDSTEIHSKIPGFPGFEFQAFLAFRSLILRRSEVTRSHSLEGVRASDLGPSENQARLSAVVFFFGEGMVSSILLFSG